MRPAILFLIGLLLSLIMLAVVYWILGQNDEPGIIVDPALATIPESVYDFNHKVFVKIIGPYVCVYWLVFIIIYSISGRMKSIEIQSTQAVAHFICALIGFFMIVILVPILPGGFSDIYIGPGDGKEFTQEMADWLQEMFVWMRIMESKWGRSGAALIFAGVIISFFSVRRTKRDADPS